MWLNTIGKNIPFTNRRCKCDSESKAQYHDDCAIMFAICLELRGKLDPNGKTQNSV